MDILTPANLLAYSAQIGALVLVASALPALVRVNSPACTYAFWQAVLVCCLLLPWAQTPRRVIVSAPPATTTGAIVSFAADVDSSEAPATPLGWWNLILAVIVAGGTLRLAWLLIGVTRLRRLRQSGDAAEASDHGALGRVAGARTDIRYVDGLVQPVTFGIWQPVVLLPATLREQPPEIRDAVLAHELSHVRRRDAMWVIAEEGVRAALWFHPAIWWVIGRIRLAREHVVDECAVGLTGRRRAYLQALLTFAESPDATHAAAFGGRRHLFGRIKQIAREDVMSSKRLLFTSVVLAIAVVATSRYVMHAFPLMQETAARVGQPEIGPLERLAMPVGVDQAMPAKIRDVPPVFPDDPIARDMSARVTLRLTLDESGAVAEVRVLGFGFASRSVQQELRGDNTLAQMAKMQDSTATFGWPAALRGAAGDFGPASRGFIAASLDAVRQWQYDRLSGGPVWFDTTIHFAGRAPSANAQAVAADSPLAAGAIRVGDNIKPPTKIRDARPIYPADARRDLVQGLVEMEIRIEADGRVSRARVLKSVPMLDEAAVDAVRQWQFTPTLLNGVPTPVVMVVTIQFRAD